MKPRDLYSGPAPAAMGMMGQGLLEAGANIGRTLQSGYESLGKSIGSGLQAVGQAYAAHKEMTADVAAKEKAIDTFLPYLPEDKREAFKTQIDAVKSDTGIGLRDKKAFYDTAFSMLGQSVGHQMAMEKIAAETSGRLSAATIGVGPEYGRLELERQKQAEVKAAAEEAQRMRKDAASRFGSALSGSAPATTRQTTASAQPESSTGALPLPGGTSEGQVGIDLEHPTAFNNLSDADKQRVLKSRVGRNAWDAYDAEWRKSVLGDSKSFVWGE